MNKPRTEKTLIYVKVKMGGSSFTVCDPNGMSNADEYPDERPFSIISRIISEGFFVLVFGNSKTNSHLILQVIIVTFFEVQELKPFSFFIEHNYILQCLHCTNFNIPFLFSDYSQLLLNIHSFTLST